MTASLSPVRRELALVSSPMIELREWRVALAEQTRKMSEARQTLEKHRLAGAGAHRSWTK